MVFLKTISQVHSPNELLLHECRECIIIGVCDGPTDPTASTAGAYLTEFLGELDVNEGVELLVVVCADWSIQYIRAEDLKARFASHARV